MRGEAVQEAIAGLGRLQARIQCRGKEKISRGRLSDEQRGDDFARG